MWRCATTLIWCARIYSMTDFGSFLYLLKVYRVALKYLRWPRRFFCALIGTIRWVQFGVFVKFLSICCNLALAVFNELVIKIGLFSFDHIESLLLRSEQKSNPISLRLNNNWCIINLRAAWPFFIRSLTECWAHNITKCLVIFHSWSVCKEDGSFRAMNLVYLAAHKSIRAIRF